MNLPLLACASMRPVWSSRITLGGVPLTLRVWKQRNSASNVEIWHGTTLCALGQDDLYFDNSVHPFVRVMGSTAFLSYAAFPGAGSGQYASVWKISSQGRKVEQLGMFRDADLRQWFSSGVIREFRPRKYATEDVVRPIPNLFENDHYRDKQFMIRYHFDRWNGRFRFTGFRIVSQTSDWPDRVHFPTR